MQTCICCFEVALLSARAVSVMQQDVLKTPATPSVATIVVR